MLPATACRTAGIPSPHAPLSSPHSTPARPPSLASAFLASLAQAARGDMGSWGGPELTQGPGAGTAPLSLPATFARPLKAQDTPRPPLLPKAQPGLGARAAASACPAPPPIPWHPAKPNVCPAPGTAPPLSSPSLPSWAQAWAREQACPSLRCLPGACQSLPAQDASPRDSWHTRLPRN